MCARRGTGLVSICKSKCLGQTYDIIMQVRLKVTAYPHNGALVAMRSDGVVEKMSLFNVKWRKPGTR